MNALKRITCVLAVLCLYTSAHAQKNWLKEADHTYVQGTFFKAIDKYKKAFPKLKDSGQKAHCIFRIAECYRQLTDAKQALVWYDKAIRARYPDPMARFHRADMLREQGKYAEAIAGFDDYLSKVESDPTASLLKANCEMAAEWIEDPEKFEVESEYLLNSPQFDFAPTLGRGRSEMLVFGSGRYGSTGDETDAITGEDFQDLYSSTRDKKGKWSEPQLLGPGVNTEDNEGGACLNRKGNVMYFTRCPREKDHNLGCDILISRRRGSTWGDAETLGFRKEDNDTTTFGHPALSSDDKLMVFVSDLPGGQGGKDLWYSTYDAKADAWTEPVNLGPHINTPHDEMFPHIHPNGNLYFSSNGHPGMGGLDIFHAEADGYAEWKNPTNLKYPINSYAHDYGIVFDPTDERGYFATNRAGGRGQDDIYSFRKIIPEFSLICLVKDKDTKEPIPNAKIKVTASDNITYELTTDDEGRVAFELMDNEAERYIKRETGYSIHVEEGKHFAAVDGLTTEGLEESTRFIKEFYLTEFVVDDPKGIVMPQVQYPFNNCGLLVNEEVDSKDSLEYLYNVLTQNPSLVIELMAHTDSRGKSGYNRKLSHCRAQTCVEYLVGKGIPEDRLVAKGYGEDRPKISEQEIRRLDKNSADRAHQTNRRTEFRILRANYGLENSGNSPDY